MPTKKVVQGNKTQWHDDHAQNEMEAHPEFRPERYLKKVLTKRLEKQMRAHRHADDGRGDQPRKKLKHDFPDHSRIQDQ